MQKFFPECFQEKSATLDCTEFGINQAEMDKQLCILQFIILNFTDLRHDHSSLTWFLFSLGIIKGENIYNANE